MQINLTTDDYFFLTRNEKYAFINHIKLNPEELAESMYVSKRTVAGNLHLVRKKLKMNIIDYHSLKKLEGN